jgi:hypothetical protein
VRVFGEPRLSRRRFDTSWPRMWLRGGDGGDVIIHGYGLDSVE